jgi:DsbC/DsbD-like thiol-disulfide interchange protein
MPAPRLRPLSGCLGILLASVLSFVAATRAFASPQASGPMPNAAAVVKPRAYVSLAPVPQGRSFEVALVVEIARGFHMNSHKPSEEYLIPTTITPQLPAAFKLLDTIYPTGRLEKFTFSPAKPLDVYTGSVTFKLKLLAQANAPLGPAAIPVILRYQACNDAACLPPVKVPVNVQLEVAAAGAEAQPSHPEIFSATVPTNLLK